MKKLMPESVEYWINKGFSDVDANEQAKKYKGYRYAGHPNYYLLRNKASSYEEAVVLANKWKEENAPTRKNKIKHRFNGDVLAYEKWNKEENPLSKKYLVSKMGLTAYTEFKKSLAKNLDGNRPNDVEYWTRQGFSHDEAISIIKERCRKYSKRCVEYWIENGFSLVEAVEQVSKHQTKTSLTAFIDRYGMIDGTHRYEQWRLGQKLKSIRCIYYWMELGYNEEQAHDKVSEVQRSYSLLQPKCPEYWLSLGLNEHEARIKAHEFSRNLSHWCIEYWIDKGFGLNEAKQKISEIQKENSLKGLLSYSKLSYIPKSNLERSVVEFLSSKEKDLLCDYVINDIKNRKVYFPDIFIKDKAIIEIFGDYWHANPKKYTTGSIRGISVEEKRQHDLERINNIIKCTGLPVIIWWESDILEYGLEELYKKFKKEIQG